MFSIGKLTVVGVGLIGGSVALAARRRGVAARVVGVDCRPEALGRALDRGLLDEATGDLAAGVAGAEVVVFSTPVDHIAASVLAAAPHCRPGALLTDAGSTKAAILRELDGRLPPGVNFVGAHPLAGSEKQGPEHARANLFEGSLVVLTPLSPDDNARFRARVFWEALGARAEIVGAEEHDRALALTSHLPHLAAAALAAVVPPELIRLTATGFRDTTRLASGDPALWAAIFLSNRAAVLAALEQLDGQLERFRQALTAADRERLEGLLREGKQVRDRADRVPFTYGEFYDYPRMIEFQIGSKWYFLRSAFDEEKDDYPDVYKVHLLPYRSEEEVKANPDYWMHLTGAVYLGQLPIEEMGFDETRRRTIDGRAFEKWLSARKESPGG
jgi:cyclohexadieny/prephenate dehydrogenase